MIDSDVFLKKIKVYPRIIIDLSKIEGNARKVYYMCFENDKDLMAVTSEVSSNPIIVESILNAGIHNIGDSRIEDLLNLEKEQKNDLNLTLIRPPSISRIDTSLEHIDRIYVSDLTTVKILEKMANLYRLVYNIVIVLDIGDGRDGVTKEELPFFIREILNMKSIKIVGISVNYSCISGILPTEKDQEELDNTIEKISGEIDVSSIVISAGGTVVLKLLKEKKLSKKIKEIRCGEGILLGTSTSENKTISWLEKNTFILEAEIIEVREKRCEPIGELGVDSCGNIPKFLSKGIRKRAVVALGYKDVDISTIKPIDPQIYILAASNDYLILDVTDAIPNYNSGEVVQFSLQSSSLSRAMSSPYISKVYKK